MKLDFENRMDALEDALDALESQIETWGGSIKLAYVARLALEELATNVIKYGYDDHNRHLLSVEFDMGPPVSLILEDDGHPFDPVRDAPMPDISLDVAERPVGGLGLHMVKTMSSSFTYRRVGHHNRVTVTFPS